MKQPMHNSLSFLTLLFMVPMLALAQTPQSPQTPQSQKELREDRMQALRVAFFVEELSLTPEESALFWPAWNEEEEKIKAHGDAVRAIETQLKSTESDAEAAELIQELKQLQRAGLELRHQAIDRIAAFIGYRRAGMIKQVEREFRTRVMKRRMKGSESNNGQRPVNRRTRGPQHY